MDSDSIPVKQEGDDLQARGHHQPCPEKGYPMADKNQSARELVREINARNEQDWNVVLETAKNSGAVSARVVLIFKYAFGALKLYGCC